MDRTPKFSKSLNKHNFATGISNESTEMENEDSPVHIACTQEGCGNVDVVWDWNSPQSKRRPKRSQKRLILSQSPKIPVKRYPSNNQIQNFEKLREELQALREAIAVPDNEESLILSPVEEAQYKDVNNDRNVNDALLLTQDICMRENYEDLFNDSADEDLVLCTQKLEADLEAMEKNGCSTKLINNPVENAKVTHSNEIKNISSNNLSFHPIKNFNSEMEDSLLNILKKVNVDHLGDSNIIDNKINFNQKVTRLGFPRTRSENQFKNSRQMGKVEFHRTQSFESTVEYTNVIPPHKLEEIERKRREAIAKLEAKRKQEYSYSPPKCSPEEIEKKRLQALAKLEAKRQDIIERKRQEALKRLQLSRKKKAMVVKSSLSTRL